MNKMLLVTPKLSNAGGVASYYNKIKINESEWVYHVEVGNYKLFGIFKLLSDALIIRRLSSRNDVNKVIFNPSFRRKSVIRDGILILFTSNSVRKIVFWHGWSDQLYGKIFSNKLLKKVFSKVYASISGYIFLGEKFRKNYEALVDLDNVKYHIETMPVEDEYFVNEFSLRSEKKKRVLFLSRLVEGKGLDIFLDVIIHLKENSTINYHFEIVGSGPLGNWLKEYVRKYKLEDMVTIHGDLRGDSKINIYRKSDIFVLPTLSEGFPNVIAEAMSCGLAIITRPVGAIPEHVRTGKNGYVIDSLRPGDFAQALDELISTSGKLDQIQELNRKYASRHFNIATRKKEFIRFLNEV